MAEHENEIKSNPESEEGEKPAKKEGPIRGEKKAEGAKKKGAAYEAGGADQTDKGAVSRESLLRAALAKAEPTKPEARRVDANLRKLLEFLKKKERGEKVNEEEKASLLELLLLLLKYLWKQLKEVLQDEEGEFAELIKAARSAGKESPQEMLKWMLGAFEFSPEEERRLDRTLKEAEAGKALQAEERLALMGERPIMGGAGNGEEQEVADLDPAELRRLERTTEGQLGGYEAVFGSIERDHPELMPEFSGHQAEMKRLLEELHRLRSMPESGRDVDTILQMQRELELQRRGMEGLFRGLGKAELSRYMGFYGPRAVALMNEIDGYKDDGIYQILASPQDEISIDTAESAIESLYKRSTDARKKKPELSRLLDAQAALVNEWKKQGSDQNFAAMALDASERGQLVGNLKELIRRDFIKPLFEKIIGDAEDDPREGFRMESWGYILLGELTEYIRSAGPLGRQEKRMFENGLFARRVVHGIHGVTIKRADPEALVKIGENLLSEDLDTLMRLEPGLGPARRIVERVLAQTRLNPEHEGRIPNTHLSPDLRGEYKPPEAEKLVAEELLLMSKAKALLDRDGKEIIMKQEEAERIAALAMKVSNLELRTAEHLSMTPLHPMVGGEQFKSTPQDKMRFDILRFWGERFGRYGRGREALLPMIRRIHQFVQPGVYEKIPGEAFDEWGVNPENLLKIAGTNSASTWRILAATKEVRELDLALGAQLYQYTEDKAKKQNVWEKVGERLPTVVSRYFPTLALREAESRSDYFNLEKRLRDGLVRNRSDFIDYVKAKAELKVEDEIFGEIKTDLLEDIESKLVSYRGGIEEAKKALKGVDSALDIPNVKGILGSELQGRHDERKRELDLQIGAQNAFLWTVAEATGQLEGKPPHSEYEALRNKKNKLKEELAKEGDEKKKSELKEAQEQVDKDLRAWHTRVKEWEGTVWGEWETLQKRLTVLEEKAMQGYVPVAEEAKKSGQPLPGHPQVLQMTRDAGFSPEELQIVERLTNLGGRSEAERGEGAARMANVEFSFIAFTEDILHEKARWQELGPPDIARRYGDTMMASNGAELIWRIANGLAGQEDKVIATRKELVKSLVEFQDTLVYLSESDRQKVTATLTHEIVKNLFKADAWWLHIPLIGPLLDMEWPWGSMLASSRAQRKFGLKALSMTAMERWRFIQDMRPFVGNHWADKLERMLAARRRDVLWQVTRQWALPGMAYFSWEWVVGPALKQLQAYVFQDIS